MQDEVAKITSASYKICETGMNKNVTFQCFQHVCPSTIGADIAQMKSAHVKNIKANFKNIKDISWAYL